MKKTISCILLAVVLTLCAGCGTTATDYEKHSYWLTKDKIDLKEVGSIDETLVYDITTTAGTSRDFSAELTGTYTVKVKDVSAQEYGFENMDGKIYYLETSLTVQGKYKAVALTYDVDDKIDTKVFFKGLGDNLQPLRSERSVKCVSPTANETSYNFLKLNYSYVTTYTSNKATTEFTYNDKETEKEFKSHDKKFTKSYTKSTYVDNEAMLFYLRAFDANTKSFSFNFNTLDAVSQTVTPMVCKLNESAPHEKLTMSFSENGQQRESKEIITDHFDLSINSDFAGTPIYLWYANESNVNNYYHRLFKMQSSLPYRMGNLVYTLSSVNYL